MIRSLKIPSFPEKKSRSSMTMSNHRIICTKICQCWLCIILFDSLDVVLPRDVFFWTVKIYYNFNTISKVVSLCELFWQKTIDMSRHHGNSIIILILVYYYTFNCCSWSPMPQQGQWPSSFKNVMSYNISLESLHHSMEFCHLSTKLDGVISQKG